MRDLNVAEEQTLNVNNFYADSIDEYEFETTEDRSSDKDPGLNYKELEDVELIALYTKKEDEWAFNEIVNRYSCRIYRVALKFTKNERDASDVLQEVFLTLFEKLETFRNESKFSTWLVSLVRNTSLLYLRKNRKYLTEQPLLEDVNSEDEPGYVLPSEDWRFIPDQLIIQQRRREMIESVMLEIPEKYRAVLLLKDVEGHSNKEIGDMLGLSLTAVKSRALRARRKMKEKLSEYGAEQAY